MNAQAIAILREYKKRFAPAPILVDLPQAEIERIHEHERDADARAHALWAARRIVEVLRDCDCDPYAHLKADLWAFGVLRKRYLVKADWLRFAYDTAVAIASKQSLSVN